MFKITSFTHLITGEGNRLAYTYSEITADGSVVSQNNKGNLIVLDPEIQQAIDTINNFVNTKIGGE